MNRPVRLSVALLVLAGLAWGRAWAAPAAADDAAEAKIRLLSAALQARDTGDTATARRNLEELIALSPNDVQGIQNAPVFGKLCEMAT